MFDLCRMLHGFHSCSTYQLPRRMRMPDEWVATSSMWQQRHLHAAATQ
jgi:hypothetical protein